MRAVLCFVLLAMLAAIVLAKYKPQDKLPGVKDLSDSTVGKYIGSKNVLVEVYAPWCPHCKQFTRKMVRFAEYIKTVHSKELVVAKVNGEENQEFCDTYNVNGYPTLLLFRKGEKTPINVDSETVTELKDKLRQYLEWDE